MRQLTQVNAQRRGYYPKRSNRQCRNQPVRHGAIIPLIGILLPILLIIAGFGLYIANAQLVRTELRSSVDFAARAGAKTLSMEQSEGAARAAAIDMATRNTVLGQPVALSSGDIIFGQSIQRGGPNSRFEFTPGGARINAVQVNGASAGNADITGFFSRLAAVDTSDFALDSTATNLDRDICLVFDRSGSMTQPVGSANNGTLEPCAPLLPDSRFVALFNAVQVFSAELQKTPQQEKVSVVSYSSKVRTPCFCCTTLQCLKEILPDGEERRFTILLDPCREIKNRCPVEPCTVHEGEESKDFGEVQYLIEMEEAELHESLTFSTGALLAPFGPMLAKGIDGATAIGSGLELGLRAVEGAGARPFAFPTIVLMTDGNHNLGIDPVTVARQAADREIVIHTITFSAGANQALMKEVAGITGGKHIHADDAGDLNEAFREIAQTLPVLLTN